MTDEFIRNVQLFRRRPRMYVRRVGYSEVCAFLDGMDMGAGGGVMSGFREWLISRGAARPELSWWSLVLGEIYSTNEPPKPTSLPPREEAEAVRTVFVLLYQYLETQET